MRRAAHIRVYGSSGCVTPRATRKLALEAEKTWKRLGGHRQIQLVMQGKRFVDGELQEAA